MESLERQLALVLFTDGLSVPPPVIEFVQTVCHSESGLLLSKFAVATLALGLSLHARETLQAIRQFVDEVNALTDRLTAMVEGDEDENGYLIDPAVVEAPPEADGHVAVDDRVENRDTNIHKVTSRQSSDELANSFNQTKIHESTIPNDSLTQECGVENSPKASDKEGPNSSHDAPREVNTPRNTDSYQLDQAVNSAPETSNPQLTGTTECPANAIAALDCSAPQPDWASSSAPLCLSSSRLSTSVSSESVSGSLAQRRASVNDVIPTGLAELASASSTNVNNGARIEFVEDMEQMQVQVSSSSSDVLAWCTEEMQPTRDNDQTAQSGTQTEEREASSEARVSLIAARLSSTKRPDTADLLDSTDVLNSMAFASLDSTKRGRRHSDGGSSLSSRLPANVFKIALNMRRRALDLMEESRKLKDSSLCMIFEHMNPSYDVRSVTGLARLDLHGQQAEEAVMLTRLHLDFCRKAHVERTEIVTGRGLHSKGGIPVLRPLVEQELSRHPDALVSDTNPNPGSFIVSFFG